MTHFFRQKCNMGIINTEFDADFEAVEKVAKKEKSDRKMEFSAYNFFWVIFCTFSTDSNSASNFAFYDTYIEFLKGKKMFCLY
jgi:hypothetical protein